MLADVISSQHLPLSWAHCIRTRYLLHCDTNLQSPSSLHPPNTNALTPSASPSLLSPNSSFLDTPTAALSRAIQLIGSTAISMLQPPYPLCSSRYVVITKSSAFHLNLAHFAITDEGVTAT